MATRRDKPTRRDKRVAAAPAQLARGTRVGRYVIEEPVGEGGMGIVYAALDPELGRKVALKVVRLASSTDAQTRLVREVQAMARLQHPNVVAMMWARSDAACFSRWSSSRT